MKNYVSEANVLTLTAPSGGVTAGTPVKIGSILVVPVTTAAEGVSFAGRRVGEFDSMPKTTGEAWAEGEILYWDPSPSEFTTTADTGHHRVGFAAAAATSGAATGSVVLDGTVSADEA